MKKFAQRLLFVVKVAFLFVLSIFSLIFAIEIAFMSLDESLYTIELAIVLFGGITCALVFIWSVGMLWKELKKEKTSE